MWIVVVAEYYYPSVFHFDNEVEARKCYEKNKGARVVHIAKVEESDYCKEDVSEEDIKDVERLDVEWYTSR